jgi:hypothetical protein
MQILYCPEYFFPHIGGGEVWSFNTGKALVKRGYKIVVVTYKHPMHCKDEIIDGCLIIHI